MEMEHYINNGEIDMGFLKDDVIKSCTLPGDQCEWKTHFIPNYGNCFTLNSNISERKLVHRPGLEGGLKIALSSKPKSYAPYVDTDGFRIVFHTPGIAPFPDHNGHSVNPRFINTFALSYATEEYLRPPYGDCIDNIDKVPSYYYKGGYSQLDCELSMQQNSTIQHCKCANPKLAAPGGVALCKLSKRSCVEDIELRRLTRSSFDRSEEARACKKSCWYEDFQMVSTKTPRATVNKGNVPSDDITYIEIYYKTLFLHHRVERTSYDLSDLASDAGGILGIAAGMSVISFVELVAIFLEVAIVGGQRMWRYWLMVENFRN